MHEIFYLLSGLSTRFGKFYQIFQCWAEIKGKRRENQSCFINGACSHQNPKTQMETIIQKLELIWPRNFVGKSQKSVFLPKEKFSDHTVFLKIWQMFWNEKKLFFNIWALWYGRHELLKKNLKVWDILFGVSMRNFPQLTLAAWQSSQLGWKI